MARKCTDSAHTVFSYYHPITYELATPERSNFFRFFFDFMILQLFRNLTFYSYTYLLEHVHEKIVKMNYFFQKKILTLFFSTFSRICLLTCSF